MFSFKPGMYHIVVFPITKERPEEEVEIIHDQWTLEDQKMCYFPPFMRGQFKKALMTGLKPDTKTWKKYDMRILHSYGKNYRRPSHYP